MNRTLQLVLIVLWCMHSTSELPALEQQMTRQGWQFKTAAGKRTIVDQGNKKWVIHYPNGTTAECEELDRTTQYIEIRNSKNKAVLRLFENYGTVQKVRGGPFKRFAEGGWLKEGDAPNTTSKFGPTDYKIRVVYFVPTDREPTSNYEKKINVVVSLISEVMTNDLRSKGFKTQGPQFEQQDGTAVVHLLHGDKKARDYNDVANFNSVKHFTSITQEVDRRLGAKKDHIVMVFAETYEEGPANRVWPGHVARAVAYPPTGGVAVFSAWMLRNEFCTTDLERQRRGFVDPTRIRGRTAIGHRGPNSPRSEFIEDGIGGMLHELAHTFGLPHDHRAKHINIMGEGFRNLRWTVASTSATRQRAAFSTENAWLLMTSRYLNAEANRSDSQPPEATVDMKRTSNGLSVTVAASDDKQLVAIVFLNLSGNDRRMITGRQLRGKEQTVHQELPASLFAGGNAKFQVIVVDKGGNYTKVTRDGF